MVIKYENNSELNCQNKFSLIMSDNIDRTVYNGFYIIIQTAVNMTIFTQISRVCLATLGLNDIKSPGHAVNQVHANI